MHDAEKTVSLDASNVKGWSRLAKAYLQLLQADEAKDAIKHGLALDAANKDLLRIQVRTVYYSAAEPVVTVTVSDMSDRMPRRDWTSF